MAKLQFNSNGLEVNLSDFDGSARASLHARSRENDTEIRVGYFPPKDTDEFFTVEVNVDKSAATCVFLSREQLEELVDKARDLLNESAPVVKCTACGEADRSRGDHGIGRCVPF